MASLPLDLLPQIAACSDPATLVRCAATCRDVRRRMIHDPDFRRRRRLRHADCFVPSLLGGCLIERQNKRYETELHMVDTTTADATARMLTTAEGFPSPEDDQPWMRFQPLASRDGLVLVRVYGEELRVCDPATGHSLTLRPEPTFREGGKNYYWEPYVLLVEGSAGAGVGRRPFQVLATNLMFSNKGCCYLQFYTFSSQNGTWGPYTKIQTPDIHAVGLSRGGGRPLVTGSVVHWLCLTDTGCYILKLDVSRACVSVTTLPASFPRIWSMNDHKYLLATTPTGERLVVLVAYGETISLWMQAKLSEEWKERAQVVTKNEAIKRFGTKGGLAQRWLTGSLELRLHWFAERSGMALIQMPGNGFFFLDLRSKEILRRFSDSQLKYPSACCPYEMDLSSWVPTFTCNL